MTSFRKDFVIFFTVEYKSTTYRMTGGGNMLCWFLYSLVFFSIFEFYCGAFYVFVVYVQVTHTGFGREDGIGPIGTGRPIWECN